MTALVQAVAERIIGAVEEVSAERILVRLDPDAPQATALNTGAPAGFPRINGYVLTPNEGGATACIISSVRIERLPFPKRKGMQQDFGLVDLPFPSRVMSLTPIGTLKTRPAGDALSFHVQRGVDVFPSVGDPVLLPGGGQLRAIVEGEYATVRRIRVGHCPTAGRAPVHVDPDKLFGRHLAVLGNTGAGKSCSVAGLVRWSLDAAKTARIAAGHSGTPNARFVVLDPNGEYAKAFQDLDFSIILAVLVPQSNQVFRLRRHNGRSHEHTNQIENETFYDFHIHLATERYQELGAREDAYARPTDRYGTLHDARDCLFTDANVSVQPGAQGELFDLVGGDVG